MRELIVQAIQSQLPRHKALQIIEEYNAIDPLHFVECLYEWIKLHVMVIDEFEELLISPIIMLNNIDDLGKSSGDCDDVAMLSASILASIGADTQLVAVFPDSDGSFMHVITRYRFPGMQDFADFDATIPVDAVPYPNHVLIENIIS